MDWGDTHSLVNGSIANLRHEVFLLHLYIFLRKKNLSLVEGETFHSFAFVFVQSSAVYFVRALDDFRANKRSVNKTDLFRAESSKIMYPVFRAAT